MLLINPMYQDHEFCDSCPGCRPAMLDTETGQPLPDTHPMMLAANRVWDHGTTYKERKSFIEVTLHNSRKPRDLERCQRVVERVQKAFAN